MVEALACKAGLSGFDSRSVCWDSGYPFPARQGFFSLGIIALPNA